MSCPVQICCDVVAEDEGLTREILLSKRLTHDLTYPRHLAMTLAKSITGSSLPHIGKRMGDMDHTTVLFALRKIEAQADEDRAVFDRLWRLGAEAHRRIAAQRARLTEYGLQLAEQHAIRTGEHNAHVLSYRRHLAKAGDSHAQAA